MTIDVPEYGVPGYALRRHVPPVQTMPVSVWWTLHGILRSWQWRATRVVCKLRDGFGAHTDPSDFRELLRESDFYGSSRPGSYAGIWWGAHDRPRIPSIRNVHRRYGLWQVAGAWQHAFLLGDLPGTWIQYDINSAYLWALSLGLPDPTTFRWHYPRGCTPRGRTVLHLIETAGHRDAPYPYHRPSDGGVLATVQEMDTYGIAPTQYYGGISWEGPEDGYDTTPIVASIRRYAAWKQIARSWWGMLATRSGVVQHTQSGARREMPAWHSNPVWAHLILARVRARLWHQVQQCRDGEIARVYCDSVVVRDTVPIHTGTQIGDWREAARYAHGVTVQSAVQISGRGHHERT